VLHYVFIQTQCVGEWKKTYAVWSAHGLYIEITDCYFYMVPPIQNGMSAKKKSTLVYPNIQSAIRPVPHGDRLPVPEPPDSLLCTLTTKTVFLQTAKNSIQQLQHMQTSTDSSIHKITEGELNNLIRNLELPKNKAELLASMLQQWNLLHHSATVTKFRNTNQEFDQFFKTVGYSTHCKDIDGMMDAMHVRHSPEQWRLFIEVTLATNLGSASIKIFR